MGSRPDRAWLWGGEGLAPAARRSAGRIGRGGEGSRCRGGDRTGDGEASAVRRAPNFAVILTLDGHFFADCFNRRRGSGGSLR